MSQFPISTIPCKYFVNGYCKNGDKCAFSHDPTMDIKVEKKRKRKTRGEKELKLLKFFLRIMCLFVNSMQVVLVAKEETVPSFMKTSLERLKLQLLHS